jgi:hypothetical protein
MSDPHVRRRVVASLPPRPSQGAISRVVGPLYGQILGAEVARMVQSLAAQGDCDWSTLNLHVYKGEALERSGLPDLLSLSAEALETEDGAA